MLLNLSSRKNFYRLAIYTVLASSLTLTAAAKNAVDQQNDHHEHNNALNKTSPSHFDNDCHELVRNFDKEKQGLGAYPQGLTKKGNGCLPPGQAKRWHLGHALPANSSYQLLPQDLLNLLGKAPAGEHYGMIYEDILLLANITELVLEVISRTDR
jgi:hypothetical protein